MSVASLDWESNAPRLLHSRTPRYGLYNLHSLERLQGDILERFMKGEHVLHHKKGSWNGTWSDMYIESTFLCYGHGPHGIVGIKMKPSALKK